MKNTNSPVRRLIFSISIMSLLLIVFFPVNVFAQVNMTNTTLAPSSGPSYLQGFYHLLYTVSGGLAPVHQLYAYNIVGHQLTFVDLDNKMVKTKILNSSAVDEMNSICCPGNTAFDVAHLKSSPCPDCRQYGLSYYFVEPEKLVSFSGGAFWDDGTKGTEDLEKIASIIVGLSK